MLRMSMGSEVTTEERSSGRADAQQERWRGMGRRRRVGVAQTMAVAGWQSSRRHIAIGCLDDCEGE